MAKALLGHVGRSPDLHLVAEVRRLNARVRELEAELDHERQARSALVDTLSIPADTLRLDGQHLDEQHLDGQRLDGRIPAPTAALG